MRTGKAQGDLPLGTPVDTNHSSASRHGLATLPTAESPCAVARLQATAATDPRAVLGVLAYWASR